MINLTRIISRKKPPQPWAEGDNIPWNDPAFSERMLKEHLSQEHDWASRRFDIIKRQVNWIHDFILSGKQAQILDLGCGPGLYASVLANKGHNIRGIDYSPTSINYAREMSKKEKLSIDYIHEDIRTADYGHDNDLVMLIYGELNIFRPADAQLILKKAKESLKPNGTLLLECHTYDAVFKIGSGQSSWKSSWDAHESGLFCANRHLLLQEHFWDEQKRVATTRYFVLDEKSDALTLYASSMQAYREEDYRRLLNECGFNKFEIFPSLTGREADRHESLMVIKAA